MLLAVLLVSVMMVSVVSAGENRTTSLVEGPEPSRYAVTPDYITDDIKIADPLDESELITLVFSESWILENNESTDPRLVKLTAEKSSLTAHHGCDAEITTFYSPSEIRDDEGIVVLRVPKKMLALFNKRPDELTIDCPADFFMFYPNIDQLYNDLQEKHDSLSSTPEVDLQSDSNQEVDSQSTRTSTFYGEWAQYYRNSSYANSIVYVTGKIKPDTTVNEGQDAVVYLEREIYTNRDGDIIELTLFYRKDGEIFLSVPIYDEHNLTWETTSTWIDATAKPYFDYYVSIANGMYEIWFQDQSTDQWYYYSYDDTDNPATAVDWLMGSSELYIYGGVQHYFEAIAYPILDEWTRRSDGTWYSPGQTFDFIRYSDDQPYVHVSTWLSSDKIYSYHTCVDAPAK